MKTGQFIIIDRKKYSIKKEDKNDSCGGCCFYNDDKSCRISGLDASNFCYENRVIFVDDIQTKSILSNDELINELRSRGFKGTIELETTIIKKYEL